MPRDNAIRLGQLLGRAELAALGLRLGAAQMQALNDYADLVRRWNPVAGLVSKGDLAHFGRRHLLDSLAAVKIVREIQQVGWSERLRLMDLGAGAGLPGVPLAVALPEVSVALVERNGKKARFLSRVQRELGLANVQVLRRDLAQLPAACCHILTARALMPPPALWRSAGALLKPQGCLLAFARIEGGKRAAAAPESYLGGSIIAKHWVKMAGRAGTCRASALLVVRKDDPDHSGGQSKGGRW